MKYLNKLATVFCSAAIGLLAMTSCEGGGLYDVNSPDWLQSKIDSIANAKGQDEPVLPDGEEDVYTIGKTDFSSGWWAEFSKYYQIPAGQKWDAVFNLNINPAATNTYKNFALILCSDADRGTGDYKEYGAIRFDNQPSGNSEWGDYIDRSCVESTLTFGSDTDPGVEKLGGRVILTIDRTDPNAFTVKMTNGTVTKTYKQGYDLPNLNPDETNTNIRAFLVPEGSYINFMQSNIKPIGGFTSALDKQPLTMKVEGMPDEVLVGTSVDDALGNISATIEFEQSLKKVIPYNELLIQVDGDLNVEGEYNVFVIYNKTFKGVNCDKPLVSLGKIKVVKELSAFTEKYVCPNPTVLGAEDNSTPWWTSFTDFVKVEPRQTAVVTFTNYTPAENNWNNFVTILCNGDGTREYAVVRADNYGWGDGYAACTHSLTPMPENDEDWAAWRAAMNGAHVTEYITNNGNGTATVKAVIAGTDGKEYVLIYDGINSVNKDEMYFRFVVDGNHLVFDTQLGAADCSSPWWSQHSAKIQVPNHTVATMSFVNYTTAANNWNNFCVVLTNAEGKEYAVVRADNYGWGKGYEGNPNLTHEGTQGDWPTWLAAMNGAKVDLTVTNNGNGTADIAFIMHGNNGVDYTQFYNGINGIDGNDCYYHLTIDNACVMFSPDITCGKAIRQVAGKKLIVR